MAENQLSGLDVAFLCLEGQHNPMHMGAVVTFTPHHPVDPARMAGLLAERAARIPRLRLRARPALLPPGGAYWADDPAFDPAAHIHVHELSSLYDPDPLAAYAARWIERPLDMSGPLWDVHLVTGLPGGEFALLLKLHHALTDGAGAFSVAAGLLDDCPVTRMAANPVTPATSPAPAPSPRPLLSVLRDGVTESAGIASAVLRATRPYPSSPISAPLSGSRRVGFVRLDLGDLRRIRKAYGGTSNDVLLAVLSGALREWMINRGQRADGRPLRALVPVSTRGRGGARGGNQLSGYLCDLPTQLDDPVRRLREIRRSMNRNKAAGPGAGAIPMLADRVPPAFHRLATKYAAQGAGLLFDTVITSVPLPNVRLDFDGARLREVYPMVPLAPRHAVGIAAATYRDSVHIGLQANGEAVPDTGSLRDAVLKSLATLLERCP
ncbi:wax ester/triacylglycerol synthase family O-acyltransferase [Amycolatopsis nigrescens]|uniref:wax ester/triacylglycerol synthase family O-acyltransferase n=1 Tax=Amycolatopsis nigrescens TaxID=381445 RepID=UPI000360B290|nr:wax ester/triacylglycerol synthase family O-acyltransferase [Amycolatopsis nigrescens]